MAKRKNDKDDPVSIVKSLGGKMSPAFSRRGPLNITSRDCVLCGPSKDCDCASVRFGSAEYLRRLDAAHSRRR